MSAEWDGPVPRTSTGHPMIGVAAGRGRVLARVDGREQVAALIGWHRRYAVVQVGKRFVRLAHDDVRLVP